MANSKYEYVREFENSTDYRLLQDCYIVVRIDGQAFHQFSKEHNFHKPNDKRCLDLMVESAKHVIKKFYPNIVIAYGESDEFSFIIHRLSQLYNRRINKIVSVIVSNFTSAYVYNWQQFFTQQFSDGTENVTKLKYPPAFDGRCVLYPNSKTIVDYLSWRQADCHINNLHNTCFYALTGQYTKYPLQSSQACNHSDNSTETSETKRLSAREATDRLTGTNSCDKHEILFKEFSINYNNELEQFKKGTVIFLKHISDFDKSCNKRADKKRKDNQRIDINIDDYILVQNVDLISEKFWNQNKHILSE